MERFVTERLDVYLCDRLAGALERTDGRISFRYLAEYLESDSPAYHDICCGIRARVRQLTQ